MVIGEEVFREIIEEWFSSELPNIVPRDVDYVLSDNALAIMGPRRAGKTFFLFQITKDLMGKGWPREAMAYINFEDIRLSGVGPNDFSVFLKIVNELCKDFSGKILLLLDEVQNIPNWGKWVRSLLDRRRYYVVITGSTAKLGIKEVSTELRGRYIVRLMLPFSFREYLRALGFEVKYLEAPERLGRLLNILRNYVLRGGFPEIVLRPELARDLVRVYRDAVFYRDVVERHGIRDVASFEQFMRIVEDSFGKYFSISSVYNYFKSLGIRKSKKTLANYLRYLEEAYYVVTVRKYGMSAKAQLQQPRKVYPIDNAYFRRESMGPMMESVVAVELLRRGNEYFYYRVDDYEVDFLITENESPRRLIQVTYASSIDEIDKRELKSLVRASQNLGIKDLLVITWDLEDEVVYEGYKVALVPLYKWLITVTNRHKNLKV